MTACFETIHKTEAFNLAIQYLNKLFTLAKTDNSTEIKLIACKALAKLTKLTGPYLQPQHLASIIPTLLELMYSSNKMGIFLNQTINNLIIALGDQKTQRGTSKNYIYFRLNITIF